MGFELVPAGVFATAERLEAGTAALHRNGTLLVRVDDLAKVKIGTRVCVLADPATRRIALRKPRDGEGAASTAVGPDGRKGGKGEKSSGTRRRIRVVRALARLGVAAGDVAGRHTLDQHEDLLVIAFGPAKAGAGK